MTAWGTVAEKETKRRIKLAIWAYAYEFHQHSIVSDHVYDFESYSVNLNTPNGLPHIDDWFRYHFKPHTGQWIYKHPQLERIAQIYHDHFQRN